MDPSMTGEQLNVLVHALPSLKPKNLGVAIEVFSIFFGVIACIIVPLRVWVRSGGHRVSKNAWSTDDYLAVLGFLVFVPSCVFGVYSARFGLGSLDSDLPKETLQLYMIRATEYTFYYQMHYIFATTITKTAIGFACMRLDQRKKIRYVVMANMGFNLFATTGGILFVLINCTPIAANWNPLLGTCRAKAGIIPVSYAISSTQLVTDWCCAIVPFFIIANLQLPMRTKVSIIAILGMGIIASIATTLRMPYFKYYHTDIYPTDILSHLGYIFFWSIVESGLTVIACSMPPLRALFKYYADSQNASGYAFQPKSTSTPLDPLTLHGKYRVSAHAMGDGDWDRLDDRDNDSHKGIIRQTDIHVSSV